MNPFISNILARHLGTPPAVNPRIPGRFEQEVAQASADPVQEILAPAYSGKGENAGDRGYPVPQQPLLNERTIERIQSPSASGLRLSAGSATEPGHINQIERADTTQPVAHSQKQLTARPGSLTHDERLEPLAFNDETYLGQAVTDAAASDQTPGLLEAHASTPRARRDSLFEPVNEPQVSLRSDSVASQLAATLPAMPTVTALDAPRPTIKVSIGQIHVRGTAAAPAAQRPQPVQQARKPSLSLEDYLKKRG